MHTAVVASTMVNNTILTGPVTDSADNHANVEVAALSFQEFYADSHDKLARALGLYFGNQDLGAEAADEAFTRAFERWQSVSQHPNPYGWVYVVGTNRARSVLRRRVKAREKEQLLERQTRSGFGASVSGETDGDPDFDTKAAVLRLKPAWRSVVIARFYLQMSVEETATALRIKPGTVKSRLSRALDQLRADIDGGTASEADAAVTDASSKSAAGPSSTGPSNAGSSNTGPPKGSEQNATKARTNEL